MQAVDNRRARCILPKIIEIIHDLGAQVVVEGIETPVQHALARDAGTCPKSGVFIGLQGSLRRAKFPIRLLRAPRRKRQKP
ncbi:MAG: hypothetical protein WAZ34_17225 [Rhodocyclaceae bacterium]